MEWIKCGERMPPVSSEVLIAYRGYGDKVSVTSVYVTRYKEAKTEKGRRIQFHRNMRIHCELEQIVGWMPLPPPPAD